MYSRPAPRVKVNTFTIIIILLMASESKNIFRFCEIYYSIDSRMTSCYNEYGDSRRLIDGCDRGNRYRVIPAPAPIGIDDLTGKPGLIPFYYNRKVFNIMDQWVQIISTYGVSIAAMIALAYYVIRKDKEARERDREFQKMLLDIMNEHKNETAELRDAIANNTLVMTKLCERIGEVE